MRASSLNAHGRASSEPRSAIAHSQGRMPEERAAGGGLLLTTGVLPFAATRPAALFAPLLRRSGYFLLATQEKVTRSPVGRVEALHSPERGKTRSRWIPACAGMSKKALPSEKRLELRDRRAVDAWWTRDTSPATPRAGSDVAQKCRRNSDTRRADDHARTARRTCTRTSRSVRRSHRAADPCRNTRSGNEVRAYMRQLTTYAVVQSLYFGNPSCNGCSCGGATTSAWTIRASRAAWPRPFRARRRRCACR